MSDNSLLAAAFTEQKELGLTWYTNLSNLINKHSHTKRHMSRCSISTSESLREEFVKNWTSSKNLSPKLEFYNKIKTKFELEKYLNTINNSSYRQNLTRYRISCHNLFIERGRYENPLVPREERWCIPCYTNSGIKPIENEIHVLTNCPFYNGIKSKNKFLPLNPSELIDMLSNTSLEPTKIFLFSKTVYEILMVNKYYTCYYKNQEFHNNTGACIVL